MSRDLSNLDAVAQAELVRTGEVSALELVDAAIARIEELEPAIGALASTDFERARERARAGCSGPLAGVPFLVKDAIAYPGMRHAMGARLFGANVAQRGTAYTDRLDAAGLIVLGKTTMSELGLLGSTETLLEGTTHNPWDLERSAGGSSGGSAAAVASRMVPMAHASDGGGSIRIPAAMNGVFGLKPSAGRVVAAMPEDWRGLVVEHCVSWSVRDSALLLSLTERDDSDLAPVGFVAGPSSARLRLGAYDQTLMGARPSSSIADAFGRSLALCRDLGHDVVDTPAPDIDGDAVGEAFFTVAASSLSEMVRTLEPMFGRPIGERDLEPFTLSLIAWFRALPAGAVDRAMTTLADASATMNQFLTRFDAVLCPTTAVDLYPLGTLAPTLDRETLLERTAPLAGYTPIHNVAGVPAMSVPLHSSAEGWPIGTHVAAPRGREDLLLSLAYELEAALPWRDRRPPPPA